MIQPEIVERLGSNSNYVVTAVNENRKYLRFVNRWISSWRMFGQRTECELNPIVVLVNTDISVIKKEHRPFVISVSAPDGLHSAFVSQVVRLLAPGRLSAEESVVMTSDIDMFPISKHFFNMVISKSHQNFVVARDVLSETQEFPMCYLAGKVSDWRAHFSREPTLELDLLKFLGGSYSGRHGGIGWNADQRFAFQVLNSAPGLVRLTDPETGHARLDRAHPLGSIIDSLSKHSISRFSDYHAHNMPICGGTISSFIIWRLMSFYKDLR